MQVREAAATDAGQMICLLNKLGNFFNDSLVGDLHTSESIESEFNRPKQFRPTYFVLEDDGKMKGAASVSIVTGTCLIKEIIVDESERKKGYGKELIKKIEEFALENGCPKVWAYSAVVYNAAGFYKKLGYSEEGFLKRHFYGIDHVIFGKSL